MPLNRRIAIDETEQEIESILSHVDRAESGMPFDELAVRQALGRCVSAADSIERIVRPCHVARELMLACVLRPTDLKLRHQFRDAVTDLRMALREERRALTTDDWTAEEQASPA